jgi:hypothetical protein
MAQYTRELLEPLHARLEAQAERIGRLEEQLLAARERIVELETPSAPPARDPTGRWGRWWRQVWGLS